jgi:hypothetical protein
MKAARLEKTFRPLDLLPRSSGERGVLPSYRSASADQSELGIDAAGGAKDGEHGAYFLY